MSKKNKQKEQKFAEDEFDLLLSILKGMGEVLKEGGVVDNYQQCKEAELSGLKIMMLGVYQNLTNLPQIVDFNYSYILSTERGMEDTYQYVKSRAEESEESFENLVAEMYEQKNKGLLKVEEPMTLQDYYNTLSKFQSEYSDMCRFYSNKLHRDFGNNIGKLLGQSEEVITDEAMQRVQAHLDMVKYTTELCALALEAEQKTNLDMPQQNYAKTITKYNKRIKSALGQLTRCFKQNTKVFGRVVNLEEMSKIYDIISMSLDTKCIIIEKWANTILPAQQSEQAEAIVVGSKHATQSVQEAKVTKVVDKANGLYQRITTDYLRDLKTYIDQTKLPDKNSFKKSLNGLVESYNKIASTMPLSYSVTLGEANTKIDQMNRWIDRFYEVSSANAAAEANGCSR